MSLSEEHADRLFAMVLHFSEALQDILRIAQTTPQTDIEAAYRLGVAQGIAQDAISRAQHHDNRVVWRLFESRILREKEEWHALYHTFLAGKNQAPEAEATSCSTSSDSGDRPSDEQRTESA